MRAFASSNETLKADELASRSAVLPADWYVGFSLPRRPSCRSHADAGRPGCGPRPGRPPPAVPSGQASRRQLSQFRRGTRHRRPGVRRHRAPRAASLATGAERLPSSKDSRSQTCLIAAASYCFAVFFAFSAALASRTFAFSAALALASRTFSHARTSRRRN